MAVYYSEDNNIGTITFDLPESKVNLLRSDVLECLDGILNEISNKEIKALLIKSAKENIFIAGADIKEIEDITDPDVGAQKAKQGQDILNKIEDLPYPTIAIIDGVALGGGCELILSCQYRLATFNDKIRIGLPEVNLGFVPGFGGTYRLPRVVGLQEGLKMILSGKPVDSKKAFRVGLVDRLILGKAQDTEIDQFLSDIENKKIGDNKYKRKKSKGIKGFLDNNPLGQSVVYSQSKKSVLALTKGFYPAPLKAIEVVSKNIKMDREKGLALEASEFGKLAITNTSKSLIHVFYLSEKYKKLSIDGAKDVKPAPIKKAGVLGAGIMGGGIAQLLSSRDIWARLKDLNYEAIAQGYKAASKVYYSAVKRRRYSKAEAQQKMNKITGTLDYSGFKSVDIVIEAVVEKMEVKQKVFKELSEETSPNTILASNTSALSVTEMAKVVKDPSRVVGFHFFNPVHRMPLVEVIVTEQTSKETTVSALDLCKKLGKTPILVKDSPGFIVNRILLGYIAEAGRILEECGDVIGIDTIVTKFGLPMGPFTLSDEVGLDVGFKVMKILEDAFDERFKPSPVFEKVYDKGLYGKKSGSGFYHHSKKKTYNDQINEFLKSANSSFEAEEFLKRQLYFMINEAAKCLEEKIVDEPHAIDVGMIFGTGFPPFHGGLLKYADTLGIDTIVDELNRLKDKYNADRFTPTNYLLELKKSNRGFYGS